MLNSSPAWYARCSKRLPEMLHRMTSTHKCRISKQPTHSISGLSTLVASKVVHCPPATPALVVQQHSAALPWIAVRPWRAGVLGAALQGLYQALSCCCALLALPQPPGQQAAILPAAALPGVPSPSRSSADCLLGRSQGPNLQAATAGSSDQPGLVDPWCWCVVLLKFCLRHTLLHVLRATIVFLGKLKMQNNIK